MLIDAPYMQLREYGEDTACFARPPGNDASSEKHNTGVNWHACSSLTLRCASIPISHTPTRFSD